MAYPNIPEHHRGDIISTPEHIIAIGNEEHKNTQLSDDRFEQPIGSMIQIQAAQLGSLVVSRDRMLNLRTLQRMAKDAHGRTPH